MAQAVDFFVDCRIFLDIGITRRDVSFWLVIIKIANKVMNFVIRKELLKFAEKLRRQRFVMRQNQCRHICLSNNIRHSERLAAASYTKQCLIALASLQAV